MASDWLLCVVAVFLVNFVHVTRSDIDLGKVADSVGSLFSAVEDCTYTCPDGGMPVERPGFKATSNGCGSFGVTVDLKSMPGMTECCNTHDFCYGRCNADKSACDRKLRSCFNQICVKKEVNGDDEGEVKECQQNTQLFYAGVSTFGCQFYLDAQKEACTCVQRKRRRNEL
ncbi:hypothetical protein CAPTEDRAFT_184158 [Capitella teleta]|uniref:Phospholipase A2 domain-containing protein n=1 Tax=Capitella teleta TaxID=283909 RepID=R7TCA4_CAPTE|nr:hypothetical protein CAPTEDRAFT_184158 [Capitella teleta]|eukprot:ELT91152.1 hypothetical protein CAPTEDRAFT_184158 [Capitella teleta]